MRIFYFFLKKKSPYEKNLGFLTQKLLKVTISQKLRIAQKNH